MPIEKHIAEHKGTPKVPKTPKTPKRRKDKQIFTHVVPGMIILILLLFTAALHWPRITQYTQSYFVNSGVTAKDLDMSGTLQLKHIFHHSTGSSKHHRLDITQEYLDKHASYFTSLTQKLAQPQINVNTNSDNLEEIYSEMDWPKVHQGKNPFTIQLPISKNPSISTRLKERSTPNFVESYLSYAIKNGNLHNRINLEWVDEEIKVPNVTDRDTIIALATISSNAYVKFPLDEKNKNKTDWIDLGGWEPDQKNDGISFGWEETGLRGHVFVSTDNKTVVIGIKGTSGAGLPGTGTNEETGGNDKTNDNLLFSCCCARVGYMWTTVCDCYEDTYTCNQDCLEKELLKEDRYYQAVLQLYRNITEIYPPDKHDIWVTGHSLGGALASLLGRTFGLPVVAFEAPGEMLASTRLHLPSPPGIPHYMENIWHFGNTADPIYMGVCNGVSSTCNVAGYAMETACHTGYQCVYDVVTDLGWRVNLLNHRIHTVIDDIILVYNDTAKCIEQPPCRDCFNWRFVTHDQDEDDAPKLPNPLKPQPTKSTMITSTTSEASTSTSDTSSAKPTDVPEKCLKRTWYGWCVEWGHDGDDEDKI